ncbi:MAG: antibiotic biosynthesis monooxygenase [Chloroflexi bacterium]|nr:antibiotic biosynthesis monooxygenase [Chloroflexota bacterium]
MAAVRLIIEFTAETEGEAEAEIKDLAERCRRVQSEPGCLQFEVFRSELRPRTWTLLEHWASEADLDEHRKRGTGQRKPTVTLVREQYPYSAG